VAAFGGGKIQNGGRCHGPFLFPWQLGQSLSNPFRFLAYLIPLDVDVLPIKFHQFLFVPKPKKLESVGQTLPQFPWK
jgi:hypothetical protein